MEPNMASRGGDLWDLEEAFWLQGRDVYERQLASDAIMHFPGQGGALDRVQTLEAIGESSRWREVSFEHPLRIDLAERAVLLAYTVRARREGAEPEYVADVVSGYRRDVDQWLLVFHQQVPVSDERPVP
jgi:hypothetical protein